MKHIKSLRSDFQTSFNGKQTDLFILKNNSGLEMAVTNFGCRVIELWVPDLAGEFADVVLGYNHIDKYVHFEGERFLGAAIGRLANRTTNGRFRLDDIEYQLPQNDGLNSLHGGNIGFDMIVWEAEQLSDQEIIFKYLSKDGEEGFPGELDLSMTYRLTNDNEFIIHYLATTNKRTIVNMTHHSFFNLHGEGNGSINDHLLYINADQYTPIDDMLLPTGDIDDVVGTPFDFRESTIIGSRIDENDNQLKYGKGYDHNWVLNKTTDSDLELAASVYEPGSGRCMDVLTTQPGIQFYGGNFFDGKQNGKSGKPHAYRETFALETQHFPDSPNQPNFPSVVLEPGQVYDHYSVYKFSVK